MLSASPADDSKRCAGCHPKQVEGYAATGMANSIGVPAGHPAGKLRHADSRTQITIASAAAGMSHRLEHDGLIAKYEVPYFVGSGNKGRSYLVTIGGRLFQSPAAYYTERKTWDLSPGFDTARELDFDRPIEPECLFCHSGRARPVPFTLNTYESPPFEAGAITCDRCHGGSDRHVARPSRSNIVNPARLRPTLRDAVCDQCHLGGEARILNPGKRSWDYRPGEPLEDVLSVYVFDSQAVSGNAPLKVVSHSEQLAASKCAQRSGDRMWCGSCHSPHEKPVQTAAYYKQRCLQCHDTAKHAKPAEDCAGCHMPRRTVYDGGHAAFTDHQILAKPRRETADLRIPVKLRPWRQPPASFSARNLGLAHISVGEKHQSAEHLNEGFRQLSVVEAEFANDATVLTSLGAVLQRKNVPAAAARMFARASRLEPGDARHRLNLAISLMEAGETQRAAATLETVIAQDPSLRDAYVLLAEIHAGARKTEERRRTLERYLKFMPQSVHVREMLRENK